MKLDMDLYRAILFKLEGAPPGGLDELSDLPPWPAAVVVEHCRALKDEGLVVGEDESMSDDPSFRLDRLTPAGRAFLNAARSDNT